VLRELPVFALLDIFPNFLEWCTQMGMGAWPHQGVIHSTLRNVVWQAFSAREGALYEPTPALHRLLDASYIADDVPVGMIRPPVDTMCVIPEPSTWTRPNGVEVIALFYHPSSITGGTIATMSCVTWRHENGPDHNLDVNVLQIPLGDPERPIRQVLDEMNMSSESDGSQLNAYQTDSTRQHWRATLDYVIKMLLYLSVRDAQVVHERTYSNAPRNFAGLGKRRRAELLAEIEQLYDRHIVGPAILDAEVTASLPGDSGHHEVRGHWRRPHFRMQPHGPNSSLRKLAFIGPTLVRPDRLGL